MLAIAVILYLAIALQLYFFNEQAVEECRPVCSEEGFDEVIGTANNEQGLLCRCFDTFSREEKFVEAS